MAKKIFMIFIFMVAFIPVNVAANEDIDSIFINGTKIDVSNQDEITISLPSNTKKFSFNITPVDSKTVVTGTGIMNFNGTRQTYEAMVNNKKFTLEVVGREPVKGDKEDSNHKFLWFLPAIILFTVIILKTIKQKRAD